MRRAWLLALLWLACFPAMLDANRATSILNSIMAGSTWPVVPAGWRLRLMTANGTNAANGTEATAGNCPGYTATGATMTAWTTISGTTASITGPAAAVSWTATGGWVPVTGIELWDTAGTPLRWMQGALSGGAVTVNNGNTLQFAIGSIGLNGTAW